MKNKLRLFNILPKPYERLGAKLFFFCKDQFGSDININMFVAFSEQDAGKGEPIGHHLHPD